jgi:phospho-N-acetylmuramoyl-pentapeptide-transferase
MIEYLLAVLASFFFTFSISLPFIKLLYRYNIRRVSKAELDAILPGRQIKFGTPIMGGTVILLSIMIFSFVFLRGWIFYPLILLICVVGGFLGAIDEYTNTLGRTIRAVRISRSVDEIYSFFNFKQGYLQKAKRIILKPWAMFESVLRMLGSEQKGMKSHYKLLTHLFLASIIAYFLYFTGQSTVFFFTSWIYIDLGLFYYVVFIGLLLFISNGFGITDGMDGLSAGLHTVSFSFYGLVGLFFGYPQVAILCFIITGAELAFLYFNINPARFEMSDVGTLPLGMLLVLVAFLLKVEFSLLFIGGIYIVEILSTIIQVISVKMRDGKRVFLVAPIHHHFEKLGWPETKVTMRFWVINVIFGFLGLLVCFL